MLREHAEADEIDGQELLSLDVDILVLAALEGAIDRDNQGEVQAKLVVEGSNAPITCESESELTSRGIRVVPDLLANAGGVTASYFEWVQNRQGEAWSRERVLDDLESRMRGAWEAVLARAEAEDVSFRAAAYLIAVERVVRARTLRGR